MRAPCDLRTPLPRIIRTLQNKDGHARARSTFPCLRGERSAAIVPLLLSRRQIFGGNDGDVAIPGFEVLCRKENGHQTASTFGIDAQRRTTPVPSLGEAARRCPVTRAINANRAPGELIRTMPGVRERGLHEARHPVALHRFEFDEAGQGRNRPWQRADQRTRHAGDHDHVGNVPWRRIAAASAAGVSPSRSTSIGRA